MKKLTRSTPSEASQRTSQVNGIDIAQSNMAHHPLYDLPALVLAFTERDESDEKPSETPNSQNHKLRELGKHGPNGEDE